MWNTIRAFRLIRLVIAMKFKSYVTKTFVVESSKAIIRDEQLKELRYQAGEVLPPGKQAGQVKTIPQRTEIKVTGVKTDSGRHTFVFAVDARDDQVYGWTSSRIWKAGLRTKPRDSRRLNGISNR